MTIKDSIVNLKKGLRTTLTNVPALIDILIRGLDGIAEAAEETVEDLGSYSTEERAIGKWINGKTIYEKTINFGTLPNTETSQKSHGIANIDQIVGVEGVAINDTNVTINLPYASAGETTANTSLIVNRTIILITTENNRTNYTGYITLRYTKTEASRSPEENDTKNGDEEKNNEEVKNER